MMDVLEHSAMPPVVDHSGIIDNFFDDPDLVRDIALEELKQHSDIINDTGVFYPGIRVSLTDKVGNEMLNKINRQIDRKCIDFEASFHLTIGLHQNGLIHKDIKKYAGVVYLNPNPPSNSGTLLASLKSPEYQQYVDKLDSGITKEFSEANTTLDEDKIKAFIPVKSKYNEMLFDIDNSIENVYNRLIIYQGGLTYHTPDTSFGDRIDNSRLAITFWFD
tara:strand:- start:89 stop:745 length:657 start_codon:yes stop_codon:yes gene_type:complete